MPARALRTSGSRRSMRDQWCRGRLDLFKHDWGGFLVTHLPAGVELGGFRSGEGLPVCVLVVFTAVACVARGLRRAHPIAGSPDRRSVRLYGSPDRWPPGRSDSRHPTGYYPMASVGAARPMEPPALQRRACTTTTTK